jgi:hypothetical protein
MDFIVSYIINNVLPISISSYENYIVAIQDTITEKTKWRRKNIIFMIVTTFMHVLN